MLINIDPLLGPELLKILRSMGHGDEIAIVDANFPAASHSHNVLRYDGISATELLKSITSVLPVDRYVDYPVHTMQVVDSVDDTPEIIHEFKKVFTLGINQHIKLSSLERFEFYDRVKCSFCVVVTGERRLYGNIIIKKGVIASTDAHEGSAF